MRTTLDIDGDVLLAAKELGRRQGRTAGKVISELAREALTRLPERSEASGEGFFGFQPLPADGVVVTNELIDSLRDEDVY
jgi:hypothetical protein